MVQGEAGWRLGAQRCHLKLVALLRHTLAPVAAAWAASLGGEPGGHLIPLPAVHHLAQRVVVPPPLAGRLLHTAQAGVE